MLNAIANKWWILLLVGLVSVFFTSCDKEKGDRDFIEFVLDGNHVLIEKFKTTQGNLNSTIIEVANSQILNIAYTGTVSSKPAGGSLALPSQEELAAASYPFDGNEPGGLVSFPTFLYVDGDLVAYTLTPQGSGTITLTTYAGKHSGALAEGTFTMTGVEKKLNSGEIVATDLSVTNGKFKVHLD